MESHLLQMRGLKQQTVRHRRKRQGSHLLQMRGLKPGGKLVPKAGDTVASFTDAWIETDGCYPGIAPQCRIFYRCVDWNFDINRLITNMIKSHLLQMRGLKRVVVKLAKMLWCRIFYRCVDWNFNINRLITNVIKSHLLQMRGLKPQEHQDLFFCHQSHLLQMRGLKLSAQQWRAFDD